MTSFLVYTTRDPPQFFASDHLCAMSRVPGEPGWRATGGKAALQTEEAASVRRTQQILEMQRGPQEGKKGIMRRENEYRRVKSGREEGGSDVRRCNIAASGRSEET